jgi:hypothetical protein
VADAIDFTRPVAVLMCVLLHFYEVGAAREIIAGHAAGLAPGSYLAVTAVGTGGEVTDRSIRAYSAAVAPIYPHSGADLAAVLGSLELGPPGVAPADTWRPG